MMDFLKDFLIMMAIGILMLMFCGLLVDTVFRPVPHSVCFGRVFLNERW